MELAEEKIKISLGGEVSTIMLYASVIITKRKHGSICASLMHLKLSPLKSWSHFIHFFSFKICIKLDGHHIQHTLKNKIDRESILAIDCYNFLLLFSFFLLIIVASTATGY